MPDDRAGDGEHLMTLIGEGGNRVSVICSCGWSSGEMHDSPTSAAMAWSMDHMEAVNG